MHSGKLLWRLGCKLHALGIKISKFDFFFKIIIIWIILLYSSRLAKEENLDKRI